MRIARPAAGARGGSAGLLRRQVLQAGLEGRPRGGIDPADGGDVGRGGCALSGVTQRGDLGKSKVQRGSLQKVQLAFNRHSPSGLPLDFKIA